MCLHVYSLGVHSVPVYLCVVSCVCRCGAHVPWHICDGQRKSSSFSPHLRPWLRWGFLIFCYVNYTANAFDFFLSVLGTLWQFCHGVQVIDKGVIQTSGKDSERDKTPVTSVI